jgi:inorganic pyrophosphatase
MSDELIVKIEIPEGSNIKYELDEETGEMTVDRVMPTAMRFPFNYGLIEDTLGEDSDALDAIIFISQPVISNVVIKCKIIGMLEMEDEAGVDHKIVCVPATAKIDPICGEWQSLEDIPQIKKDQIRHFFEHYKDLEKDKWVKLKDWKGVEEAKKILKKGQERFEGGCEGGDCEGCSSC